MANKVDTLIKAREATRAEAIPQGQRYAVGQTLPIASIRTDGGTQARAGLDDATVTEYAEAWLNLSHRQNGFLEMPPIVVFHDGSSYWLADGFHRVEAYKRFVDGPSASASPRAIRAVIQQGTQRDAILFACGANDTHGLRRTQADKRRACARLLKDDEWTQWSDSEIARRVNVDHKTVASVRAELVATGEIPGSSIRQSADGKVRDVTGIAASNASRAKPKASNLGPGQPPPAPWPDAPAGWHWNRRGAPAHLIAPDGWRTKDYDYPERALAEAQRRILSTPKAPPTPVAPFWQSMSPNHPTAHLWTRAGMNEHRAACGMTAQRAPSGSTEAGHCSSCVRATWPQNQAATSARSTCPTCGTPILNGIWGDREECGVCYHARQRVPDTPESDDTAIITEIRAKAAAVGAELVWEDDQVTLFYPGEDLEQLLPLSYADALDWLASQPPPEAAPTIESLDASLPRTLQDAGFYWKAAEPLTIAHNDGWYITAETVEAALNLAHDRATERVESADRRLSPGQYANALTLLTSIRACLNASLRDDAAENTRRLLALLEATD